MQERHDISVGLTAALWNCSANSMYKGSIIKSFSGSIKSMFASFFLLFCCFVFCFFPAAPELQLPFASKRISEDDDDDEWQGLLHLAPISERPSSPLSICYRKKGWHMPIIFLSLPLHSTPPRLQTRIPVVTNVAARHPHSRSLFFFFFHCFLIESHHMDHTTNLVQMAETIT